MPWCGIPLLPYFFSFTARTREFQATGMLDGSVFKTVGCLFAKFEKIKLYEKMYSELQVFVEFRSCIADFQHEFSATVR